jgi:site-specific recombinase XerD
MNKFETYLINTGLHFQIAGTYGRIADKYLQWLKANNLKATKVKRSDVTDWLQLNREQGNKETTILKKENVIKHYYYFLGTKNNPAQNWIKRKKEHTLPPTAIEKNSLITIYEKLQPKSPTDYRNRCMLGFVLFQGCRRSEIQELRMSDIDFENGNVFIQGQRRSNSRTLKLEAFQLFHLYDYVHKYRNAFLAYKKEKTTDRLFLSCGEGNALHNSIAKLVYKLKRDFPYIEDLRHIRGSVITNWQKQEGIIEAMQKAGHRYVSSTERYQTNKYEELQELLKSIHPLESMKI